MNDKETMIVEVDYMNEAAFQMPAVQKTYKTLAREFHGMQFVDLEERRDRLALKIDAANMVMDFADPMNADEEPNPVYKGVLRSLKKVLMELHVRENRLVKQLLRYREEHPTIKQAVHE